MSEHVGRTPEKLNPPPDEYNLFWRMLFCARLTEDGLSSSWKRPKRHNRSIERFALYWSLQLDQGCEEALIEGQAVPSNKVASAETRYEVQAAIRTVHVTLPFMRSERTTLTSPKLRNPDFRDESAVPDRELLERWHEWLWKDDLGAPQTSVEALGASAVLYEGSQRLVARLPDVVERLRGR